MKMETMAILNASQKKVINLAVQYLKIGKIIAYPTEAVYGLGCDIHNTAAVERLCQIKKRALNKGFIIIASEIKQLLPYCKTLNHAEKEILEAHWPGPYTFILPATDKLPALMRGQYSHFAARVSQHPLAAALCQAYGKPIVSTSANISSATPLTTYQAVLDTFGDNIDFILPGEVGNLSRPTPIIDLLTGKYLRR